MHTIIELAELLTSEEAQAAVREAARNLVVSTGAKTLGSTVVERLFKGERREVEKAYRDALTATLRKYEDLREIQAPLARWLGRPPASDAFLRVLLEPTVELDPAEFHTLLDDTPFDPATFPVPVAELISSLRNFFLVALFRNPKTRSLHDALSQQEHGMEHRWMLRRQGAILSAQHRMEEMLQELLARIPATQDHRERRIPFMAEDLPEHFVERQGLFEKLRGQLLGGHGGSVTITTALHGAGGFGKTTLALALCHDREVRREFEDGILWVTLGETPDILGKLAELYAVLTGERPPFRSVEDAAVHFAEALGGKRFLLVLDDVWKRDHLAPFRRGGPSCVRLITSRNRAILSGAAGVDVDEMSGEEAVGVLTKRVGSPPRLNAAFAALARRLGEWPLLLDLAAAALQERMSIGDSAEGALQYLNQALDRRGAVAFDQNDTEARNLAVARTLGASLGLLDSEARQRLLEISIFPEDVVVPLEVLEALWETDAFETEELVQRFHRLSLLKFEPNVRGVRLHDVIRARYGSELALLVRPAAVHNLLVERWGDLNCLPNEYAWRWIAYHLQAAEKSSTLLSLLMDYTWISAKLESTSIQSLLTDYNGLPSLSHQVIQDALRLSAHVLSNWKQGLASQLLGRLNGSELPAVQRLLQQVTSAERSPWLMPVVSCLEPPSRGLLRTLGEGNASVETVALTADGRHAVSVSKYRNVQVWDLETGTLERTFVPDAGGWISDIAISANLRHGVIAGQDGSVQFWNFETGELLSREFHDAPVICVGVTADGTRAVSASRDCTLRIWSLQDRISERVLEVPSPVICVALTQEGGHAVTVSEDHSLRVWDLESGSITITVDAQRAMSISVATTTEGLRAITCSSNSVMVWDFDSYRVVSRDIPLITGTRCVAVSPDGNHGIVGTDPGEVHVCDLEQASILRTLRGHERKVNAVAVSSDGRRTVSASSDGTLKTWDPAANTDISTLGWHQTSVDFSAVSDDGARAVTGARDGTWQVWNVETATLTQTFHGRIQWQSHKQLTRDGRKLVSFEHSELNVWDTESGALIKTMRLPGNSGFYNSVLTNEGRLFVTRSTGGAELWDLDSDSQVKQVADDSLKVVSITPSPDGHSMAVLCMDGVVRVLDAESGSLIQAIPCTVTIPAQWLPQDIPLLYMGVRMSWVGANIALFSSHSKCVHVLDVEVGNEIGMLPIPSTGGVRAIALGNSAVWIVSTEGPRRLQLWNLNDVSLFGEFIADSALESIALTREGRVIAGDAGGRVIILKLMNGDIQ